MNKELIDKFKTITKKIENPIIKNLLIEMIDTIEEQSKKITNLEDENEDLKATKAGQHATIEILEEMSQIYYEKRIELQNKIEKAIEYIKDASHETLNNGRVFYNELPAQDLLNILQGEDKDE